MVKHKMLSNVIIWFCSGIFFPGLLALNGSKELVENLVNLLTAQFVYLAFAAILNPISAVGILLVVFSVFCQDTAVGRALLEKMSPFFKRLFGRPANSFLALGIAAIAGFMIQVFVPNFWALLSVFAIAQVFIFLGVRAIRDSNTNKANS